MAIFARTAQTSGGRRRQPKQRALRALAFAAIVGLSLLAAACGSSSGAKVAQVGTTGSTNGSGSPNASNSGDPRAYSACMRSHGVPNFPDPDSKGRIKITSGRSSNDANQSKVQEAFAPPTSFQQQMDPISCCGFASQTGGTGNHETITQSADLKASEGLASQTVDLEGSSNSDPGSCTFNQRASTNTNSADNSGTVGPPSCPFISASISCTSGNPPTDSFGGDFVGDEFVVGDVVPQQEVEPCVVVPPSNID